MKQKTDAAIDSKQQIDWGITIFPLVAILALAGMLMLFPDSATQILGSLKSFLVNDLGFLYMIFGLGVLLISLYIAFSKYGNIKLGNLEKPRHSNFSWGAMIFTSTMAADILFYSLIEWGFYYNAHPFGIEALTVAQRQDYASMFPLFHWGPIAWGFYILPAAAYGYMMYVKKSHKQRMSEACRPIFGKKVDGPLGKVIDIFAIVGLLAATATTFAVATPLLSGAFCSLTGMDASPIVDICILAFIALVFTLAVLFGIKGISKLATVCIVLFFVLLAIFFFCGPTRYIIESGITGLGGVANNFISMATWMDPLRLSGDGNTGFPQDWTVFYWAYWISWSVATPFFIGKISEGRTIRQTIIGAYISGVSATFLSFIVFGNYGLYQQTHGVIDPAGILAAGGKPAEAILQIFGTLPWPKIGMIVLVLAMISFYASTFDALTLVISSYSVKNIKSDEEPSKQLRIFWCIVFIVLPTALLFNESTLSLLQTLSICAALPIMIIIGLIIAGFIKDLRSWRKEAVETAVEKVVIVADKVLEE